ncbi:MAG: hypothetical protein QXG97_04125, partial [Nitrososphaerota archaeon]
FLRSPASLLWFRANTKGRQKVKEDLWEGRIRMGECGANKEGGQDESDRQPRPRKQQYSKPRNFDEVF